MRPRNNLSRMVGLLVACAWLAVGAVAQAGTPTITTVELPKAPAVPVWLVEAHRVPIIALQLQFDRAGYAYDPDDRQGLAQMASQLLMEGAGERDAAAFQEALDDHAIQLSAEVDEDVLMVRLTTLREHAPVAMALLKDALTAPRVDEDALERLQRLSITRLKQLEEEPGYIASRAWRKAAFGTHPYAHLKRGTPESVQALTADDVRAHLASHLTRANVKIAISGDATPADIRGWLAPMMEALPDHIPVTAVPPAPIIPAAKPVVVTQDHPQTQFMFSLPAVGRKDAQFFVQLVLNQIVGGDALSSRLAQAVRDQRGLTYGIGTSVDTNAASALWVGSFSTRNAKAAEALGIVRKVLKDIASEGVTAAELRDAKNYLQGSLAIQLDGTLAMADFLATLQRYGLTQDYFETRAARIDAVTASQVQALAAKMFATAPMLVVAVGKPDPAIQ